jgi:hypothetical protein
MNKIAREENFSRPLFSIGSTMHRSNNLRYGPKVASLLDYNCMLCEQNAMSIRFLGLEFSAIGKSAL